MAIESELPMRLSDAADITVRFGPTQRTLLDLIDGWCGHVTKISEDSHSSAIDAWGVHDLIASLYIRDAVERGLRKASGPVSAVAAADALFLTLTKPDVHGLLRRFDSDIPQEPWWWMRIPSRGPISEEVSQLN